MTHHDLSRHLFRPAMRYTGVRMQQGRALLDSDFSEAEMLDDEDLRAVVVDVVGPHGSSDSGFTITNVSTGLYNFDIAPGSYYLGGMRHEITGRNGTQYPQRFSDQSEWQQSDRKDVSPQPPALPTSARHDLVYLVGWEQVVSAVEDREFHEIALGGPDTAGRVRRMHRVLVRPGGPADCGDAFDALVADLEKVGHIFDRRRHELLSGARLTVVIDAPVADTPCKPALAVGYTGVENQALRIQLIEPQRFLWSYDNAAPLYRVVLTSDAQGTSVQFLTPPRDQAHHPVAGQVLEILPWGAQLDHQQSAADHQISGDIGGGVLARVQAAYDPTRGTVLVKLADAAATLQKMSEWFAEHAVAAERRFFYVRVWNPGDGATTGPIGLPFKLNVPVELRGTGLRVRFSKQGIIGDHWIVAARPGTPSTVVPWTLTNNEAPHGPRRHYCALALLHWAVDSTGIRWVDVDSCRRTFRPLTRQGGCCTVTVGDGVDSVGEYTSINAAIAAIPIGEPGRVCVLPGQYRERVVIENRSDLVIEGCGRNSRILTPAAAPTSEGLITITNCSNITLEDLRIETKGQFGVMIYLNAVTGGERSRGIKLIGLDVLSERAGVVTPAFNQLWIPSAPAAFPLPTIAAAFVDGLEIHSCKLTMTGELSGAPNVTIVDSENIEILDCQIHSPLETGYSKAWGGMHLGGNCRGVAIEDCEIQYGIGCGITFGSAGMATVAPSYRSVFDPVGRFVLTEGMSDPGSAASLPETAVPIGGGASAAIATRGWVTDVRIRRNRVRFMGSSAISVLGFLPEPDEPAAAYQLFITEDLVIADNILEINYQRPAEAAPDLEYLDVVAFGGVVLGDADGLRIQDNVITSNGVTHVRPVCGIYVAHGDNIVIENNKIRGNGPRGAGTAAPGLRAGIAVMLAGRRVTFSREDIVVEPAAFLPAARIRGNAVSQPAGRALQLYGMGPMFVEGNILVSEGVGELISGDYRGHCIDLQNIGQSPELVAWGAIPSDLGFLPAPALLYDPEVYEEVDEALVDGRVLFTDNQVRFNPVLAESTSIGRATRINSYGDVAVLDNQFFAKFPTAAGHMEVDTTVTAWSTRTASNRWEDPALEAEGVFQTDVSARTLAMMNATALNQATRCIYVHVSVDAPTILENPIDENQTYIACEEEEAFESLLLPPPPP